MWGRIRDSFQDCALLPACRLKTLFDIMLNSAMPKKVTVFDSNQKTSIPQDVRGQRTLIWNSQYYKLYSVVILSEHIVHTTLLHCLELNNHIFCEGHLIGKRIDFKFLQFIKDDVIDDDEIRQLLNMSSEEEGDSGRMVGKGYDGDTETSQDECKSNGGSDPISRREYFPSLFRLIIELLIKSQEHQAGKNILPQVLLKLLQTLKGNSAAIMVVCEEVKKCLPLLSEFRLAQSLKKNI